MPRWFARLTSFGLALLRPFLPARFLGWLEHMAWFLTIGLLNTLLGWVMFVAFVNLLDLGRVAALLLAYLVGTGIAYNNFSRFVFTGGSRAALVRFFLSYILLYLCNQGLLELMVRFSGWSEEVSQFVLLPAVAALSYGFNRFLVFGFKL